MKLPKSWFSLTEWFQNVVMGGGSNQTMTMWRKDMFEIARAIIRTILNHFVWHQRISFTYDVTYWQPTQLIKKLYRAVVYRINHLFKYSYLDRFVHPPWSRCYMCRCRIHLYYNMSHCCHTGDLKNIRRYLKQKNYPLRMFQGIQSTVGTQSMRA